MKDFDLEVEEYVLDCLSTPAPYTFYTIIPYEGKDSAEISKVLAYHNKKFAMYERFAKVQTKPRMTAQDLYWAGETYIPFSILGILIALPVGFFMGNFSWTYVFKTFFWAIAGFFIFKACYGIFVVAEYMRINRGRRRK